MKPVGHIVSSGALGLAIYALKGEPAPAVSCFMAGWLVDLDHIFDWVNNLGLRRGILTLLNVYNLLPTETFEESKRDVTCVYLPFHSWEPIIGFWLLYAFYPINPVITGAFLGLTLHLALDQKANRVKHLAYFFTYRMLNRFEAAALKIKP